MNSKNKHPWHVLQSRHQACDHPHQHHAIALIDKLVWYAVRTLAHLTDRTSWRSTD
ncbi:MAG: hypothetical protein KYX61_04310 [Gammaproteobacteria bacterium]|nr:hypothetical protein [Gammaproteobacteria bacterium]